LFSNYKAIYRVSLSYSKDNYIIIFSLALKNIVKSVLQINNIAINKIIQSINNAKINSNYIQRNSFLNFLCQIILDIFLSELLHASE